MDSATVLQYYKYYDMEVEHAKDLKLYTDRQISQEFLDRLFNTPHDRMWYPDEETLLGAGVITGVVGESP